MLLLSNGLKLKLKMKLMKLEEVGGEGRHVSWHQNTHSTR